jgi:predicted CXXCH cytochrome family protein
MKFGLKIFALFLLIFSGGLIAVPGQVANAEGQGFNGSSLLAGLLPDIPQGKGDKCIAPTDFMRRNHMNLLKHDRDETVYFGNRQVKASLKDCVACHAVKGVDNKPITVQDPKHFCRACHDYVAVKIDCFECHASRPPETLKSRLDKALKENQALAAFVKGSDE